MKRKWAKRSLAFVLSVMLALGNTGVYADDSGQKDPIVTEERCSDEPDTEDANPAEAVTDSICEEEIPADAETPVESGDEEAVSEEVSIEMVGKETGTAPEEEDDPDAEEEIAVEEETTAEVFDSSSNEAAIWSFFIGKGLSEVGTAAIMGNLKKESGFQPNNLENSANNKSGLSDAEFTARVDSGAISRASFISSSQFGVYTYKDSTGTYYTYGYGLAQWTFYSRKRSLYDYWKKNYSSVSIGNLNMQLNYLYSDMGNYSGLKSAMTSATDISDATVKFHNKYEGSADSANQIQDRINYAKDIYSRYHGIDPDPDPVNHKVDTNYPKNITAVPLATSGTIHTFDVNGNQESGRWIDYNDVCTINEVYTDNWCQVTYPSESSKRTAYVKKDVFFAGSSIINNSWSPAATTNAYKRSNMAEAFGSVWTTDVCKVTAQSGSNYQVIFPLDAGGYKLGWVKASTQPVPTPTPAPDPVIIPGPVASGAFNGKKIVAVAPEKISFSSSAYIDKGDICKLTNVNPSTGQCTVEYPSGSNNVFTATKTKIETVAINKFINYNGSAQAETVKIPEKLTAYPTSAMTATVGSYTSNWYLDPGDTYTTINKIGSATEVLYYCSSGAHAGYWKLGWVNLSYYSLDLNGYLDNVNSGTLSSYGRCDIYINGVKRGANVTDFYLTDIPRGSTYSVDNICASSGYTYNGLRSGSSSGTITGNVDLRLSFTKDPAKETGISIATKPTKVEYIEGQELDTTGLSVVLNYEDGSGKDVTSACSFSGMDSTPGTKTILVSYGSYTTAFTVVVEEKKPVKLTITKLPDKCVYQVGDELDLTGMAVKIDYDNGSSSLEDEYYISYEDSLFETAGKKSIRVEYSKDGVTVYATYDITVEEPIDPPTLSVNAVNAEAGKTFSVPLVISGNPGLASMKLTIAYDEAVMTLTDISYNSAWEGNFQQPQTMRSPVILNWYNGAANYTGNTTFATLAFTARDVASEVNSKLTISYDPEDIFNIDERNTGLKLSVGAIHITPGYSGPLQITGQPVSVKTEAGKTVSFHIDAVGNGLSYQWQYSSNSGYSWVNSSAETAKTPTYSFNATAGMDGRMFRCVVTDASGSRKTSNVVLLTLSSPFYITSQPADVQAGINSTVSFHVAASGQNLSYRWQYSKNRGEKWIYSNATGANTDTISIKVSASNAPNIYRCQVTDGTGTVLYSETAGVDVLPGVVINLNPQSQAVPLGEYAIFTIDAENAAGYQWQYSKDGAHWYNSGAEGNTTDTLKVKAAQNSQGNRYRCVVLGTDGNKKKSLACAMIVMKEAPKYSAVAVGGTASYSVKAEGVTGYQWQYSKDGGETWYKSGATGAETDTVTFRVTTANRLNIYRCKLTTEDGAYAFTAPVGFIS